MSQNKKQYATLQSFSKKKIVYLQPYFYQNGKWYKVKGKKSRVG